MNFINHRYINPFTDFGFKKLFGTEPNKDLLIDFLNEVILPERHKIVDLTYGRNEQLGISEFDRKAVFDLYCIGQNNEHFIVEMQKARQNYFKDRSLFYASFPIQQQAVRGGDWDFKLSEVFTVAVLDFIFSEDKAMQKVRHEIKMKGGVPIPEPDIRHVVQLKDQHSKVFYDKLTFIYLEMPHFTKTEEELETTYDKWLYLLKYLPTLENRPAKFQEQIFEKLFAAAEIAKFTPVDREAYEESLKHYRDLKNVIDTAVQEAKEDARIEGKIEGKMEGISRFLKAGKLSVEEIAEGLDVTVDFVLQIKAEQGVRI